MYGQGSDDRSDFSIDTDTLSFGATYYLRPVDTSTGPLAERAFVDKAASLSLGFSQSEFTTDGSDLELEVDTLSASTRFVTAENFIAVLAYSNTETEFVDDDLVSFRVGVGKYLDDRTTVIGSFTRTEIGNSDLDQLGVVGRRLVDGSSSIGTYLVTEAGLEYLDADDDSGFDLSIAAIYYTSAQLGLGAGFNYRKIDSADSTTLSIEAKYFLTPQLSIAAEFSRSDSDFSEIDLLNLSVTGRF